MFGSAFFLACLGLLSFVSAMACDILGFGSEIDVHMGLFELGFDSLSAIDFKVTMEAELGCPRERVEGEEGELCLGVMMHRLRMLLDVYVETEGEGGGSAAVCGTMCSRRVRGRDRRKPLIFDARSGQFDQSR